MKVLLSCDENPFYYDFWPSVKKMWSEHIGIEPVLIFINKQKETDGFEDGVLYLRQRDNYPIHLQAQMARIFFTQYFPDEVCFVSDIDMFPISKSFFDAEKIEKMCNEDSFFHLNPERREFGQFPLCYYCGPGSLFSKVVGSDDWDDFLEKIVNMNFNTDLLNFRLPDHLSGKKLWFSDEIYMHTMIQKLGINIVPNDTLIGHNRIDREQIKNIDYSSLLRQDIVDIHLPRPYKEYERYIDNILFTFV